MWFRHGDHNGNWKAWVERLDAHLEDYTNATYADEQPGTHAVECGEQGRNKPGTNGMCKINQKELFQVSGPPQDGLE